MENIKIELGKFPLNLEAIKAQGTKYLNNNSNVKNGVINILHRPWVAPMNWGMMLFVGAELKWFEEFTERTNKNIPDYYKDFLRAINGCFIYDLSLYGLTPSIYSGGLLDRSNLQCHDITTANNQWIREYDVDSELFHFGGRAYSDEENIGYFSGKNDIIMSIRTNGEILKEWDDFSQFLKEEINEAEKMMIQEVPEKVILKTE
jgi:hypothetical protein